MGPDRDRRMSVLGPVVAAVLAAAIVGGGYLVRAQADPGRVIPPVTAMHDRTGIVNALPDRLAFRLNTAYS